MMYKIQEKSKFVRLYMHMSVMHDKYVYFTTTNGGNIYRLDTISGEIVVAIKYPCEILGEPLFIKMVVLENKLWMIPWNGRDVILYDFSTNEIKSIEIPSRQIGCDYDSNFIEPWMGEGFIWLHPTDKPEIIRLDIHNFEIKFYNEFPQGTRFEQYPRGSFEWMTEHKGYLYLFRDKCNHNLKIDISNGEVSWWNHPIKERGGLKISDDVVMFLPVKRQQPITLINLDTLEEELLTLPSWIWGMDTKENDELQFGFIRKIEDCVYLLPFDAKAMVRIDIQTRKMKYISWEDTDFNTTYPNNRQVLWDVYQVSDEIWGMPYMGNQIIKFDIEGNIIGTFELSIPNEYFTHCSGRGEPRYESFAYRINDFIKGLALKNGIER